jgi:carbonic anhydrase
MVSEQGALSNQIGESLITFHFEHPSEYLIQGTTSKVKEPSKRGN